MASRWGILPLNCFTVFIVRGVRMLGVINVWPKTMWGPFSARKVTSLSRVIFLLLFLGGFFFTCFVSDMGSFEDLSEQVLSMESGSAAIVDLPPIESHPSPSVTWLSDGGPLPYDRKFAVTSRNQLVILAVSSSDQRAYRFVSSFIFCRFFVPYSWEWRGVPDDFSAL